MKKEQKRIFVGGTGRSGTTLLYKCIGLNPEIYTLPTNSESRFIIDHDGIEDLIDNLTSKYDVDKANESVRRFKALMLVSLTNPHDAPYFGKAFGDWFGPKYYNLIENFVKELVVNDFVGSNLETHNSKSKGKIVKAGWKLQNMVHKIRFGHRDASPLPIIFPQHYTVKYFSDRDQLIELCSNLVDDIFMLGVESSGKKTWCEKTPSNLMHIKFIKELFPDSLFVHILRDPRGAISSMMNVPWAPSNVRDTAFFLKELYKKWFEVREKFIGTADFHEVKLEDFVVAPEEQLKEIYGKAGISSMNTSIPETSLDRISSWKEKFSRNDIETINEILGDEIKTFGYEL